MGPRPAWMVGRTTDEAELSWPCSLLLRRADASANSRQRPDGHPSPTFPKLHYTGNEQNIFETERLASNAACTPSGLHAPYWQPQPAAATSCPERRQRTQ